MDKYLCTKFRFYNIIVKVSERSWVVILPLSAPKGTPKKSIQIRINPRNLVKLFLSYELDAWLLDLNTDVTLGNYLFEAVKLTKNADTVIYSYSGYGIVFDHFSLFLLQNDLGKNIAVFGVDNSSFAHIDNKQKHILVLGVGPTQLLDDTAITAEAEYFINFLRWQRKFCLSIHYNGRHSFFLSVNATKIYHFKTRLYNHIICV